ncbi:MAG: class I SAM-dependent methyltransferase [Terriglobales bacterium]
MTSLCSSRRFWDSKALENPYWYVSSFVDYTHPNLEAFWQSGARIWNDIKQYAAYRPDRSHTVVEIGCGIGRLSRVIGREVGIVHAFDISPEMIERGKRGAPANIRFHLTSGDTLQPLAPDAADLVLAYLVFQHLPNEDVYAQYLREMVRVAKPGASVVFTTSPRDWKMYVLPLLRAKAYLCKGLHSDGPKELYRREWTGIRPSVARTRKLCPVPVQRRVLADERWLYCGIKPPARHNLT